MFATALAYFWLGLLQPSMCLQRLRPTSDSVCCSQPCVCNGFGLHLTVCCTQPPVCNDFGLHLALFASANPVFATALAYIWLFAAASPVFATTSAYIWLGLLQPALCLQRLRPTSNSVCCSQPCICYDFGLHLALCAATSPAVVLCRIHVSLAVTGNNIKSDLATQGYRAQRLAGKDTDRQTNRRKPQRNKKQKTDWPLETYTARQSWGGECTRCRVTWVSSRLFPLFHMPSLPDTRTVLNNAVINWGWLFLWLLLSTQVGRSDFFFLSFIIIIINSLTARVVGAPQMILQPVFSIFPCSPLPSWTCRTPGLSIPWCRLPTSSFVRLVFFPISLCLARWFWPDLMNGKHDHTAVCVSLRSSGDLHVVQLPAGSWHGLPCW